ncbi:hypothetical protein WP1_245 [Pseudomonas phage WP1]
MMLPNFTVLEESSSQESGNLLAGFRRCRNAWRRKTRRKLKCTPKLLDIGPEEWKDHPTGATPHQCYLSGPVHR